MSAVMNTENRRDWIAVFVIVISMAALAAVLTHVLK
jgi:hypothetical protein